MMVPEQMNRQTLLSRINMAGFAVTDINLYLDTHPDDAEAIRYFKHFKSIKETALKTYASKYGPLTVDESDGNLQWDWIDSPWPWEGGEL
jgi:spore coat protein JB